MANGYLGKISAVVTANTADFQAKLEDAASDVRKFSREVQNNITKAMGDAEKSIQSIYTPLQRLEGSLKAAGDLKLKFKGFAGAIKDVEDLKSRLGSLNAQQLSIVFNESGFGKLKEVRAALREIGNRDIRLFDAAGGLRELQKLQAGLDTARGQRKLAKLGIDESELDSLIQKFKRFPKQRIDAVINVLGQDMLDSSLLRTQQLHSLVEQVNKPLAAAVTQFQALSNEVQAAFIPALNRVQQPAQNLADAIKRGCTIGREQFDALAAEVDSVTISIKQLSEASALVGNLKTGREFAFDQPGLNASLTRAGAFGNTAAEQMVTSPSTRANSGAITSTLQQITAESNKAMSILAALKEASAGGRKFIADSLQADLDRQVSVIDKLVAEGSKHIDIKVTTGEAKVVVNQLEQQLKSLRELAAFQVTGNFQNSQQTVSAIQELIGMLSKLDDEKRKAALTDIGSLISVANGDDAGVVDLEKFRREYDDLKRFMENGIELKVEKEKAQKKVDDLRESVDSLKEAAEFQFTGTPQTEAQAKGEISRIIGKTGGLDDAALSRIESAKNDAIKGFGEGNFAAIGAFGKLVDKELQAKKAADDLRDAMAAIGAAANPTAPIDILKKNLEEAKAAVAKLDGQMKEIGERNIAKIEAFVGKNAGNEAAAVLAGQRAGELRDEARSVAPEKKKKVERDLLGEDFGTSARSLSALESNVVSLQGKLERLPTPLQAQFIPAINDLRSSFKSLTIGSTQAEIDAAVEKANELATAFDRAEQAARLGGTLGESLNLAAFTRAEKQIGFIRAKLLEVGAAAEGPVANAFDTYSDAASKAAMEGTIGTAKVKKELDDLIEKIGEAAVAEGLLTKAQAKAFTRGVGDVGRAGADKFALALNQAAFAVDDFMSSTGGLEFKLRAVSNNITQLAFILGGTTGLFVGLGAVIAGQAAVGLIKWMNNGRSAEDQTKALNDALARQKSLVEDLAKAFESLGDSMSRGTFSAGGEQADQFARQMKDIKKKQDDSVRASVSDFDPAVIKERAEQRKLQGKIEKSQDVGEIVGLQAQMEASKKREKEASDRAVAAPLPDLDAVQKRVADAFSAMASAITQDALDPEMARDSAKPFLRKAAGVERPENVKDARDKIQAAIDDLSTRVEEGFFNPNQAAQAKKQIQELQLVLNSLGAPLLREIDKAANQIAEASRGPAAQIRHAQEDVANAIKRGVPNAAAFQRELEKNATKLKEAYAALSDAQKETDPDKKQAKVDEAKANVAAVQAERANIDRRSRELRMGRTFGGNRTTEALSSLQGNERFKNDIYRTSFLERAINREVEALQKLERATATGVDAEIKAAEAELEAARRASEAAAAFAEASLAIEAALTRIRKIGESALQKSEQGADAAQRAFEENPLRAGGRGARDEAEQRLIDDRAAVADAQDDLNRRRIAVQADPRMVDINDRLEAITQRRKDLEAKSKAGGLENGEQAELAAATKEEIELIRQREELAHRLTAAEREQLDAINNGIAAREKEMERSRQRTAEEPTFNRLMNAANQVMADSERQASEAEQRFASNPTEENRARRVSAQVNVAFDRERVQELQDNLENKRKEIEQSLPVILRRRMIAHNDSELAELAKKEAAVGLTEEEKNRRKALQEDNREKRREIENKIDLETMDEERQLNEAQMSIIQRDRATRGRDLGMKDRERFRKDFEEGAGADIAARAKELKDQGKADEAKAFMKQAITNQLESVAPMLKQFDDERQTALLNGPSRARLTASDVSTSQGQSELTRLLRGEDSAKDVNLAELKKQTERFDEMIKVLKEQAPGVLL